MMKPAPSLLSFMFFVVMITGCGPKAPYDLVLLEGTATYAGQPIPKSFRLTFQSLDGKRPSTATVKSDDGAFVAVHTLQQDGVPKGKCKVNVLWGGDIGTVPPPEFGPMLQKYGFGSEGLELEFSKNDRKYKLDFPE